MCVLIFSTILSEIFFILRRTEQYIIKMYIGLHVKYRYFCQILRKLEFYRQSFEKYNKLNFHDNPSSGSRDVPCGQTDERTDKHDEANSRYSQFANAPNNQLIKLLFPDKDSE
jgi:hypothetical protein